jgi:hypothetical protein
LEAGKGNPFDVLMPENLEKLTSDMNLHVSDGNPESRKTINTLIDREKICYEEFLDNHLEVLLTATLDGQVFGPDLEVSHKSEKMLIL